MTTHLLVSTDWLAEHLHDPNLRIVDIRGHVLPASEPLPHYFNHYSDYVERHISGAVFIDWVEEITDPADPRHAQIAKPARFAEVMSRHGISNETMVVVYDDAGGMFAARLWWSLNYYGHHKVAVLDGGWNKWLAEGRETDAEIPFIEAAEFIAQPQPNWYRNGDDVLRQLQSETVLMDVRSLDEFEGRSSRAKRKGHIPSASNLPRNDLLAPDGTMLPIEVLRQKFAEIGIVTPNTEVVTYCNGGVSASFGLLALRVAGFENNALYDGSWKEWGNDESKPIE